MCLVAIMQFYKDVQDLGELAKLGMCVYDCTFNLTLVAGVHTYEYTRSLIFPSVFSLFIQILTHQHVARTT